VGKEEVLNFFFFFKYELTGNGINFLYSKVKHIQNITTIIPQDFSGLAVVFDTANIGKSGFNSIRVVTGGEVPVMGVPGCNVDFRNSKTPFITRLIYKNKKFTGVFSLLLIFSFFYFFFIICLVAVPSPPAKLPKRIFEDDPVQPWYECAVYTDTNLPLNYYFGFSGSTGVCGYLFQEIIYL
jgi:hypothetical protein